MLLQAEQEAIARGCRGAWLDTYSFQARGFYERLGYAVFGILNDYPPGQKRIFLHKVLVAWNDAQAGTTGQSSACFTARGPARWPVSYFLTARHI
jgi:ribosomal protein S18 acetylase RimI-like enzyme